MKKINFKFNPLNFSVFLASISLLVLFSLELFAKKDNGFIEWRSIPAANGYRVEIKSNNKIIVETNVTENIYYVDLPKGKYEFRIGVLNYFKKPVVWSYWNPLRVIVSREPVLNEETLSVPQGELAKVKGNYFLENTKVTLLSQGKSFPIETKILSEREFSFSTKQFKNGVYDILLENPNNKNLLQKNYFVLYDPAKGEPKTPKKKTVKTNGMEITSESSDKADISITDSGDGKTVVNIGPKTKDKLDISLQNKSNIDVEVDINNRAEGKVTFNVDNKSKNKLGLNVKNFSNQEMGFGILEKSNGKVDINVPESSKNKVHIKKIKTDISDFDVTIDNQTKEKFDINIGEPPKVIVPTRKPAKVIEREDITISADSLKKVDINVDESNPKKLALNIDTLTKEDVDISLENRSKESVTIDINNRSEGKVNLSIENKSKENLALNVNQTSYQKLNLGIIDKSVGNVDVQIKENPKNNVEVKRINSDIEFFDVTIDNKTKDIFDVNIGKKPVEFRPSTETFPKDYQRYSLRDFETWVKGLQRTCASNLDVPDILIDKCHPRHVSLNLGDQDRKVLYNYIKLGSGNYISRISAYKFFIDNCNPNLKFIIEHAESRLTGATLDDTEKFYTRKTIDSFNTCKNRDER